MNQLRTLVFYKAVFIVIGIFLLSSCVPERKIANKYVKSLATTTFIVIPPNKLLKSNLSADKPSDTASINQTQFLKHMQDSIVLSQYKSAFIETLRSYGLTVKDTTMPYQASDSTGRTLVLDIAQLSLEEYLFNHRDSQLWDTMTIYKDFVLRGLSINLWLDLSAMDGARPRFQTLFNSQSVSDKVDGDFKMNWLSGEIMYKYTFQEMQPVLANSLAAEAGSKQASMLVDYLINEYVKLNMPPNRTLPVLTVSLDRFTGKVKFVNPVQGYILME